MHAKFIAQVVIMATLISAFLLMFIKTSRSDATGGEQGAVASRSFAPFPFEIAKLPLTVKQPLHSCADLG